MPFVAVHPSEIPAAYHKPIGQLIVRWGVAELYLQSIIWHVWKITDPRSRSGQRQMRTKTIVSIFAVLLLVGCDQKAAYEKGLPYEDVEFAKTYLALFQARDFDAIEAKLDGRLKDAQLRGKLQQMAAAFPAGTPTNVQTIGVNTLISTKANGTTVTQVKTSVQYQFGDKWLLGTVLTEKTGGHVVVTGVNVQPLSDSLEKINQFTFFGKGVTQYAVLSLAILSFLVIVIALILIVRTPIPKRKWLWFVFALFGVVQLTVNWTDGGLNINPFALEMFGAAAGSGGPYAPVLVSASIPLGAVIFLLRRRKWRPAQKPNED